MCLPGSIMDEMKQDSFWRFRLSIRETVVAVVVGALAIGVFLGVIHVMAPDSRSPEASTPQATETAPAAATAPDDYSEDPESPS